MRKTKTHKTKAKSLTLELNTLWPGVDSEKAGKLIRDFFQDFMSSPVGQFLSGKEDDVIDNLRRLKVQHGHALFRRIQNLPKDFTEADRKELMELANAATTDGMVIGALESGMRSGRDRRRKNHEKTETSRKGNDLKAEIWHENVEKFAVDVLIKSPNLRGNEVGITDRFYDQYKDACSEVRKRGTVEKYLREPDVRARIDKIAAARKGACG